MHYNIKGAHLSGYIPREGITRVFAIRRLPYTNNNGSRFLRDFTGDGDRERTQ